MGATAAIFFCFALLLSFLFPEDRSFAEPNAGAEGFTLAAPSESYADADALRSGSSFSDLAVFQDTTRRPSTGVLRAGRGPCYRSTPRSTRAQSQSAAKILEAIKALPRDSSARLLHFGHIRRDAPTVDLSMGPTHPLYLPDPFSIRTQQTLDSTRFVYHIRKIYGTTNTRIPLDLSLDEYRQLRLRQLLRKNWEEAAHAYQLVDKKKGLGDLFGSVTNIEIPVPKNPLFSIFGPNRILLSINGAVDIHGAFRNTTSDLYVNNPLGQSRSEPDFSQEVQVNVKGQIGDKLNISADWNTQRTFEYREPAQGAVQRLR